jgi:VIT1/CCC1 family predicted Fe2+/Mn2+ transporter
MPTSDPHAPGKAAPATTWSRQGPTEARDPLPTHGGEPHALVAGAVSMALGEYVSVSSQRDSERAQMARERRELAEFPLDEWDDLSAHYAAKGLSPTTARQIAEELTEQNALAGHLETELNIDPEDLAGPAQGAGASALSFTLGASSPRRHPAATPRLACAGLRAGALGLALTYGIGQLFGTAVG